MVVTGIPAPAVGVHVGAPGSPGTAAAPPGQHPPALQQWTGDTEGTILLGCSGAARAGAGAAWAQSRGLIPFTTQPHI